MSYFQATDGTTLHYREYGDGRPVVLLASQGLSSSMWQHLMVRLADQGFRCVALDRRGHGRSDDPGKGYDFDRFADDVSELVTRLDLRDVMLVGHSVGGAEAGRPAAKSFTSASPAMKPPMCAAYATPPSCAPPPSMPSPLTNWNRNQSPSATYAGTVVNMRKMMTWTRLRG